MITFIFFKIIDKNNTMNSKLFITINLLIFILYSFAYSQNSTADNWLVGFAETDITPLPGVEVQMSGYGVERYAHGTYRPLKSQVIALRDKNGNTAIFVSNDVVAFDRVFVESIRRSLLKKHGIPKENIMLLASHTHWGPQVAFDNVFSAGGPNVWFTGWLEDKILEAADLALSDLSPAYIQYTSFDFRDIACNRRLDVDGEILMRPNPEGSFDGHTPIIHITRNKLPRQIIMVGYSSHVTDCGGIELWSPGYPGAMRDYISAKLPDAKAMFIQGVGGDAKISYKDPKTGKIVFSNDTIHSRQAGEALAKAVLTHLKNDKFIQLGNTLSCAISRGQLSYGKRWSKEELEDAAFSENKGYYTWAARQALTYPNTAESFPYEVQLWKFGNELTLFGMEDEVCSPWGKVLRSMAKTNHAMVAGYANNTTCYIPDAKMIEEGGYESIRSQQYLAPAPFTKNINTEIRTIVKQALSDLR